MKYLLIFIWAFSSHAIEVDSEFNPDKTLKAINKITTPVLVSSECITCETNEQDKCVNSSFKNKSTLYIGDSHSAAVSSSGSLSETISSAIEQCTGAKFSYYAACGSAPIHWNNNSKKVSSSCGTYIRRDGKRQLDEELLDENKKVRYVPNLNTLLETHRPENMIVNLGDNMFSWKKENGKQVASVNKNSIIKDIRNTLQKFPKNTQCVWIGPTYHSAGTPYYKPNHVVDQFYDALKEALNERCKIIDGRKVFKQTNPRDGLHLSPSEYKQWGESIVEDFKKI